MSKLIVSGLCKRFGSVQALDNVSAELDSGRIYGLLGRNGAGKTTLLNIIASRVFADKGLVTLDAIEVSTHEDALRKIHMMGEKNLYPDNMRVSEAIFWGGEFYPSFDRRFALDLAKRFTLDLHKRIKFLSTGFASILRVVIALSTGADFILLDEPTLGMDANHRDLFYRVLLERFADKPATYVLSTHLIAEAADVIEDVLIIHQGKILRSQTCESLLSEGYTASGSVDAVEQFARGRNVLGMDKLGSYCSAYLMGSVSPMEIPKNIEISGIDLQKLFIQLTNTTKEEQQ